MCIFLILFLRKFIKHNKQKKKEELINLVSPFNVLSGERDDVKELTEDYITNGAIAIVEDALHVAIASVYKIGVLASWNYKHLVKLKTKREVNAVNLMKGYNTIEIVEPTML